MRGGGFNFKKEIKETKGIIPASLCDIWPALILTRTIRWYSHDGGKQQN